MLAQMESMRISFHTLRRENDNRMEGISKLGKKLGFSREVKTDKETRQPEFTNDSSTEDELEKKQMRENFSVKNENIYIQPNSRFPAPMAPVIIEEERIKAKTAIETIRGING